MGRLVFFPDSGEGGKGFGCMLVFLAAVVIGILLLVIGGVVGWFVK